jgi:hypothetical protein
MERGLFLNRNRNLNLNPPTLADPTRRRLPAHAHDQGMCCGSIRVHGQSKITIMITNQRPHQNCHAPAHGYEALFRLRSEYKPLMMTPV